MMDQTTLLDILKNGRVELQGQLLFGSNGTFLVKLHQGSATIQAVYKPSLEERPLWDFQSGTLGLREAAAFLFDQALQWELVPPTIYRQNVPLGPGSLQVFIPHDPLLNYFHLAAEHPDLVQRILLFDFMLNNADRKAGHFILDNQQHVWLIDHGLTFHTVYKLRTIAWEHAGEDIPEVLLADISHVQDDLVRHGDLFRALKTCLAIEEVQSLSERINTLLSERTYPRPPSDRRAIPWPPI